MDSLIVVGWGVRHIGGVTILLGVSRLVTVCRLRGERVVGVVSTVLIDVVGWCHRVHMGARCARSRGERGEGSRKPRRYKFHG